jgi:hypothetical protein
MKFVKFALSYAIVCLLILSAFWGCKKNVGTPVQETWKPSNGNHLEKPLDSLKDKSPVGTGRATDYTCSSNFGSSYYSSGYYRYPDYNLDLSGTAQGSTISVPVYSYDVPNRFTIKDNNGYTVAYTSWMGYANYSGPWGMSLNTAETQTLTFTRDVGTSFVLIVETVVNSYSDAWDASVGCTAPTATWINPGNAGAFHNNALTAIDNSFTSEPQSLWYADYYSKGYENTYVSNNHIDLPSSVVDSSYGFRNKLLHISYNDDGIYASNINFASIADSMMNLSNTSVLMTGTEKTIMQNLFTYYGQYASGQISYSTMKSDIASLKTTWSQQGFNTSLHQGDISAYTLNIADSSVTFMYNYNATYGQRTEFVPLWLAADAVGALGGAIAAGMSSYSNTGHVNWKDVGWWALGGAISSSVPGTKWFRALFK